MAWSESSFTQQGPNPYEVARGELKSSVMLTVFADSVTGSPMIDLKLRAMHVGGRWVGKISGLKLGARLGKGMIPEVGEDEEVATAFIDLEDGRSDSIIQEGQQAIVRSLRISKDGRSFEARQLGTPVVIGVVAALAVGAVVVVKRHHQS